MTRAATLIPLIAALASAQTSKFEVASVRLADQNCAPSHTVTPTQVTYVCTGLHDVISDAYSIPFYRTDGLDKTGPNGPTLVTIAATMPDGATKQQIPEMLQNLLADRFHLKTHRETREGAAFELTVEKSGHKLHENTSNPEPGDPAQYPLGKPDGYGMPELPNVPGHVRFFLIPGKARAKGYAAPLAELIKTLEPFLKGPITDHTGLAGKYDFTLNFEGPEYNIVLPDGTIRPTTATEFFPPIPNALSKQLGLHLERKKLPVEFLVLDSISLTPTPN